MSASSSAHTSRTTSNGGSKKFFQIDRSRVCVFVPVFVRVSCVFVAAQLNHARAAQQQQQPCSQSIIIQGETETFAAVALSEFSGSAAVWTQRR